MHEDIKRSFDIGPGYGLYFKTFLRRNRLDTLHLTSNLTCSDIQQLKLIALCFSNSVEFTRTDCLLCEDLTPILILLYHRIFDRFLLKLCTFWKSNSI